MFPSSTQKKCWTFKNEDVLMQLRYDANRQFIEKHQGEMSAESFLTLAEEQLLFHYYELKLREFCRSFRPVQPPVVCATACHYFKRFYLKYSIMDFHPKEMLVACVYLACKVEEFNVSMSQFVANVCGDRDKASRIILDTELFLLEQLNFQVTIHNPYRPVEGLLIHIKTHTQLQDPDRLRPHIYKFIEHMFFTDACLLYAPSQLALAAVLDSASKLHENLDSYVIDSLLGSSSASDDLSNLVDAVRKIRSMVKSPEILSRDALQRLQNKLETCRNPENDPDSPFYQKRTPEDPTEDQEVPGL